MIFIGYRDWKQRQLDRLYAEDPLVPCSKCKGDKDYECTCCECGHTHDAECSDCNENGMVHFSELERFYAEQYASLNKYEEAVLQDATLLAEWTSTDLYEILIEKGGMHPWQPIKWGRDRLRLMPPEFC